MGSGVQRFAYASRPLRFYISFYQKFGLAMSGGTASLVFLIRGFVHGGKYTESAFFTLSAVSFLIASYAVGDLKGLTEQGRTIGRKFGSVSV